MNPVLAEGSHVAAIKALSNKELSEFGDEMAAIKDQSSEAMFLFLECIKEGLFRIARKRLNA